MLNKRSIYAVCRWNHKFSSRGRNRIFGRRNRIRLRQTPSMMRNPSTMSTSPAPRELHTLYLRVFNKASLVSDTCEYLFAQLDVCIRWTYHPNANTPQCNPCQQICHNNFLPVNSRLYQGSASDIAQCVMNIKARSQWQENDKQRKESTSDRKQRIKRRNCQSPCYL